MTIQIDPETGIVFRVMGYAKEKRRVYWARCPDCGPQPPSVEYEDRGKFDEPLMVLTYGCRKDGGESVKCSICGLHVPLREAITPVNGKRPHEKCNRRCLDGKYICNCACQGRCHGEGTCYRKKGDSDD